LPAVFLVLAACSSAPPAPVVKTPASVEPVQTPEPVRPVPVARPKTTFSVAAVGDMMIGTNYPKNHLPDDDAVGFLRAVTPWLAAADVTFGNLEGVLLEGGVPEKECKNLNACYLFRSPARYVERYFAAGFDVMSVANNHARDFGEDGRTATMQTLAYAGILHSGREGDFAHFNVKGLSVSLMAFSVTQESNLVHDYDVVTQLVTEQAANYDIVIVSFHAGAEGRDVEHLPFAEEEYYREPRGDVVRFARLAVDAGADLVLGHGPHVVRAMEIYKDRLISYSLGNFATYYGISVDGNRGIAPILHSTLDQDGRFIEGRIFSTVQIRPGGPVPDPEQRALNLIRDLSQQDFGSPGIDFQGDGRIIPTTREFVRSSKP
jgi:poly-gamma-glutamate capsule biosynthesis protein CapA/YwtB (metallophosphatase superfamily)